MILSRDRMIQVDLWDGSFFLCCSAVSLCLCHFDVSASLLNEPRSDGIKPLPTSRFRQSIFLPVLQETHQVTGTAPHTSDGARVSGARGHGSFLRFPSLFFLSPPCSSPSLSSTALRSKTLKLARASGKRCKLPPVGRRCSAVERQFLYSVLSPSCVRTVADG